MQPPRRPRNPRQHGQELQREVESAASVSRREIVEGIDPRLVFKLKATTRLPDSVWEPRGLGFLGEAEGWVYFVITETAQPDRLAEALSQYATAPDEEGAPAPLSTIFGNIDGLESYGPDDRRGIGIPTEEALRDEMTVDIQLWPSTDHEEASQRVDEVHAVVGAGGGEILDEDRRPQLTLVRARVSRASLLGLLDLAVVETIRTPPTPYVDPSDWITASTADLDLRLSSPEPVGVIDDGVAVAHPLLRDLVRSERSFPSNHAWRPIGRHGTHVAGLAAYGDFEAPIREGTSLAGGPIHIGRVLEPHPTSPDHTVFPGLAHRSVEEAIRTMHTEEGVRVFNLSSADGDGFAGPHVSLWTESLDELVRELGVVVVVAAGNHRAWYGSGQDLLDGYPSYILSDEARVAEPGIAVNVLTVGSLARSDAPANTRGVSRVGDRAVAGVDQVSPFSRSGLGIRNRAIKPELVHYGGNFAISDAGVVDPANPGVGVVTTQLAGDGRLFVSAAGTSLAAPRVARLAADLWARYPEASANLTRCLVAASTSVPAAATDQFPSRSDRLRAYGFGRPALDPAAESGPTRTLMYHDGSMRVDSVDVLAVPIPEPFARGRYARRIRVCLAFDPPVRRQRREYVAGTMRTVLLRNVEPGEIATIYGRQPIEREDRAELIQDRRRVDLQPGVRSFTGGTLQVRDFQCRQLNVDDGDMYYLLVIHQSEPWAGSLRELNEVQDYAVAVVMEAEEEVELDLRTLLEQRLRQRIEIRLRA